MERGYVSSRPSDAILRDDDYINRVVTPHTKKREPSEKKETPHTKKESPTGMVGLAMSMCQLELKS